MHPAVAEQCGLADGREQQCGEQNDQQAKFSIDIPYGLSLMIDGSTTSYVPGIEDLLAGRERSGGEQPAMAPPYSQRMEMGVLARQALTRVGMRFWITHG